MELHRVPRFRLPHMRGEVRRALVAVLIARTAVNGGKRVVYPFLPAIARGVGVPLQVIVTIVGLRALMGLAAPLVARLAERYGRRRLMLVAVGLCAGGCLLVAGLPVLPAVAVGLLLTGLAKPAFDVPMQAWFGDRVPFARRGRVLGATEFTWALSMLATVPLSGFLIEAWDWRAPFILVAFLCGIGLIAVRTLIAPDRPTHHESRPLKLTRERWLMLGVITMIALAAENIFVVYGAWLEDDLGLSVSSIGLFTLVVIASELVGEGTVTLVADRLGLRRTVLMALLVSATAYACLGLVGTSLAAALVVVVVWFVAFEISIVTTVPIATELAPESRDRIMSLLAVAVACGQAVGALIAGPLYALGGVGANGLGAAAAILSAAVLLTLTQRARS